MVTRFLNHRWERERQLQKFFLTFFLRTKRGIPLIPDSPENFHPSWNRDSYSGTSETLCISVRISAISGFT